MVLKVLSSMLSNSASETQEALRLGAMQVLVIQLVLFRANLCASCCTEKWKLCKGPKHPKTSNAEGFAEP